MWMRVAYQNLSNWPARSSVLNEQRKEREGSLLCLVDFVDAIVDLSRQVIPSRRRLVS